LITAFVESTVYGLFLCLYAISNAILFRGRKTGKLNIPLVAITFVMFCFATLHAVNNNVHRLLAGFLAPTHSDAIYYFATLRNTSNTINSAAYVGQTLLGDGFLLYRLFVIWEGNRIVMIPSLVSYLGCVVTGIGGAHAFTVANGHTNAPLFASEYGRWILAFTCLTLFTNLVCTSLIAGKIWWIHRRSTSLDRVGGQSLATPMIVIIESGAIYSISLIVQISLYASGSLAVFIIVDSATSIIGVTFLLIIVRLGLGLSAFGNSTRSGGGQSDATPTQDFTTSLSNLANGNRVWRERSGAQIPADGRQSVCQTCRCGNAIADVRPLELRIDERTDSDSCFLDLKDNDTQSSIGKALNRSDVYIHRSEERDSEAPV